MTDVRQEVMQAEEIILHRDGEAVCLHRGEAEFARIMAAWEETTKDALQMPAFGVSLDPLTRERMQKTVCLEFCFSGVRGGELPFLRLLVFCEPAAMGFNLERQTEGRYQGRCYYLDLRGGTMRPLCDAAEQV